MFIEIQTDDPAILNAPAGTMIAMRDDGKLVVMERVSAAFLPKPDDRWTCQMRCVAIRSMPHPDSSDDHLYTFVNIDGDGSLTQIIEDDEFCIVGDVVRVAAWPISRGHHEKQ